MTYLELLGIYGIDGAHPGGLPLTKIIVDSLPITHHTWLLDVGCGTGQTLSHIAGHKPCKLVGVDLNKEMLKKAALRCQRFSPLIDLVLADIHHLPFPSDAFDIAISESVTLFADTEKALDQIARVIKPGGLFVAVEMAASANLAPIEHHEIRQVYGIERIPTTCQWEEMLKVSGFDLLQVNVINMAPTIVFTSRKMAQDFAPHLTTLSRYRSKLMYMLYICQKGPSLNQHNADQM